MLYLRFHNFYIGSIVYIRYWMLYIRLHILNWILYGLEPSWSHLGSSRKPYIGFYKTYIGFYRFGAIVEPSWELPKAFTIMLFRCTNGKSEGDESSRREDECVRQNVQTPKENQCFWSVLRPCKPILEPCGAIVEPSWELLKAFTIMLFCCTNGKSEGDERCRREDDHVRQNVHKP